MDIFDQAMEIEKEGESLYRQFSLESPNKGMKTIFSRLADQELKHYDVFKKMKEGELVSVAGTTLVSDVRNIFDGWKSKTVFIEANTAQEDLYRKALEVEKKSVSVYTKYAETAGPSQKNIFLRIAAEEKGHQRIIENILEFVTKPQVWVENAEFSHLEEDYYL